MLLSKVSLGTHLCVCVSHIQKLRERPRNMPGASRTSVTVFETDVTLKEKEGGKRQKTLYSRACNSTFSHFTKMKPKYL